MTMLNRAMHYIERDPEPGRVFSLNELRKAAGIAIRSQYRLAQQMLDSGMVERAAGGYRLHPYLLMQRHHP